MTELVISREIELLVADPDDTDLLVEVVEGQAQVLTVCKQGPPGPRGPQGANGLGGNGIGSTRFSFGDATPVSLGIFSGVVMTVTLLILQPFDGVGAELHVSAGAVTLVGATDVMPSEAGVYEVNPGLELLEPTSLQLHITPGIGATAGNGIVILEIIT